MLGAPMSVVLMTTNARKVAEYRRFLARHAQTLHVEAPTEAPHILRGWLEEARAVVADESNVFDPSGDLVQPGYVGPARNVCRLHAWVLDEGGALVRRSYLREVQGHFDATRLRPDDPTVFDWDSAFTSAAGATLEQMDAVGLKNSAREQCLSAFVRERLRQPSPRVLKWTPVSAADWSMDARLLLEHPLYRALPPRLDAALRSVVDAGVFFRAVKSRRDGNYWLPGLNGGLPYVPKADPVHEATYLFHDVMHHLMPDLVFDGAQSEDHRRTYIVWRMMSEAVSLALADMTYVDALTHRPEHAGYDFTKRRIHPLFAALPREKQGDLRWLLHALTRFVVLGEACPAPPPARRGAPSRTSTRASSSPTSSGRASTGTTSSPARRWCAAGSSWRTPRRSARSAWGWCPTR